MGQKEWGKELHGRNADLIRRAISTQVRLMDQGVDRKPALDVAAAFAAQEGRKASTLSILARGDEVWYHGTGSVRSTVRRAKIRAVHLEDAVPYYTIANEDGGRGVNTNGIESERQTQREKLMRMLSE